MTGSYHYLLFARVIVHESIDRAAAKAVSDITLHVTQCRRAMGQRFRKLNRDIHHDTSPQ
jgi:hypothetical protein